MSALFENAAISCICPASRPSIGTDEPICRMMISTQFLKLKLLEVLPIQ
jgi:hypothetical protein